MPHEAGFSVIAFRRSSVASIMAVAGLAAAALSFGSDAATARTTQVRERASLKLVKKSGTTFVHSGRVTGTLPGSARSRMTLNSLSISGTVTIRAKGGSVNLRIRGRARSGGQRPKFNGSVTIAGGTGRYANARGRGHFDGVVNRQSWATTISASGSLAY